MKTFLVSALCLFLAAAWTPSGAQTPININQANAKTLATTMVGVGLSRAQDIVNYRAENGPFKSLEDLIKVRGIGRWTLERNRSRITISTSEDAAMSTGAKPEGDASMQSQ